MTGPSFSQALFLLKLSHPRFALPAWCCCAEDMAASACTQKLNGSFRCRCSRQRSWWSCLERNRDSCSSEARSASCTRFAMVVAHWRFFVREPTCASECVTLVKRRPCLRAWAQVSSDRPSCPLSFISKSFWVARLLQQVFRAFLLDRIRGERSAC